MNLNCILKGEISISLSRLYANLIQFDRSFDPIIAFTCLSIEGIKTLSRDYDGQQNRSSLCEKSPSFDCENKLTNLEKAVRLSPTERFNHFRSRKGSSEYFQNTKKKMNKGLARMTLNAELFTFCMDFVQYFPFPIRAFRINCPECLDYFCSHEVH